MKNTKSKRRAEFERGVTGQWVCTCGAPWATRDSARDCKKRHPGGKGKVITRPIYGFKILSKGLVPKYAARHGAGPWRPVGFKQPEIKNIRLCHRGYHLFRLTTEAVVHALEQRQYLEGNTDYTYIQPGCVLWLARYPTGTKVEVGVGANDYFKMVGSTAELVRWLVNWEDNQSLQEFLYKALRAATKVINGEYYYYDLDNLTNKAIQESLKPAK